MAILEMIPREYWRQLYKELQSIWEKLETDRMNQERTERERRSAEYNEAIKKKQKDSRNKPEAKARKKEYQRMYWAKKKQQ